MGWRADFPKSEELNEFLGLTQPADLDDLFERALFDPLDHLLSRPGKNLRAQLVKLGYQIGSRHSSPLRAAGETALNEACNILELIHAASLIVDDIEDGSDTRRGGPSLHQAFGVPIALNAGNWLYFQTFRQIEAMALPESRRSLLIAECHRMLLRAHFGQALDVGVPLDSVAPARLHNVTMAAIELKSGVLAGFGLKIGAILSGCPQNVVDRLETFGRKLGMALQMFDDIGNITSSHNTGKATEDFRLRRLGFVVATAARMLPAGEFERLARLPLDSQDGLDQARSLLRDGGVIRAARDDAERFLTGACREIEDELNLDPAEKDQLANFQNCLRSSYD